MCLLPAAQPTTRGLPASIGRPRRMTVQMPAACNVEPVDLESIYQSDHEPLIGRESEDRSTVL